MKKINLKIPSSDYWDKVYSEFHENNPNRISVWNESPTPFFNRHIPFMKYKNIKIIMVGGCGDGREITPLVQEGFNVIGVDFSEKALYYTQQNNLKANNLKLLKNSLDNIDLPGGSLDAIICNHVLTHIPNVDDVLSQFYLLIKQSGYAFLEFTSKEDSTFGKGKRISDNVFIQKGVYLRYDESSDIERMLKNKFEILSFSKEGSTDPPHGKGYIRKQRHKHSSYFVIARKV